MGVVGDGAVVAVSVVTAITAGAKKCQVCNKRNNDPKEVLQGARAGYMPAIHKTCRCCMFEPKVHSKSNRQNQQRPSTWFQEKQSAKQQVSCSTSLFCIVGTLVGPTC